VTVRIDFRPAYQTESDLDVCLAALLGLGPSDESMAYLDFERALDEAWERLTSKQQNAVLRTAMAVQQHYSDDISDDAMHWTPGGEHAKTAP
jgi:hypothetical protein